MIVEQMLNNAPKPLLHIADVSGSALFQGDCLDIMPLIPDNSIDMVLCDLPYGTTQNKWDSVLPLDKLWNEYKRVLKDNGVVILNCTQPFTSVLVSSNLKMYKYSWTWVKNRTTNYLNAKKQPLRSSEEIAVFYNKQCTFNPIPFSNEEYTYRAEASKNKRGTKNYGSHIIIQETMTKKPTSAKDVIFINTVHPDSREYCGHTTQKPLELAEYLIKTYTNDGDVVLDNTMGSGTTCLAAKELNRRFIGIEKEANYYEIACRRCGF
jgi:site-specific DNA-methyltransferase (adenine-specific)